VIHQERLRPPSRDYRIDECLMVGRRLDRSSGVGMILQGQSAWPPIYNIPTEVNQLDVAALAEGTFRGRQNPEADPNA
jgi:hypothetical protein